MGMSAAEQAIAEGWELRICPAGHVTVTKPEATFTRCNFDIATPLDIRCNLCVWWLFDDADAEAAQRRQHLGRSPVVLSCGYYLIRTL